MQRVWKSIAKIKFRVLAVLRFVNGNRDALKRLGVDIPRTPLVNVSKSVSGANYIPLCVREKKNRRAHGLSEVIITLRLPRLNKNKNERLIIYTHIFDQRQPVRRERVQKILESISVSEHDHVNIYLVAPRFCQSALEAIKEFNRTNKNNRTNIKARAITEKIFQNLYDIAVFDVVSFLLRRCVALLNGARAEKIFGKLKRFVEFSVLLSAALLSEHEVLSHVSNLHLMVRECEKIRYRMLMVKLLVRVNELSKECSLLRQRKHNTRGVPVECTQKAC